MAFVNNYLTQYGNPYNNAYAYILSDYVRT